MSSIAYVTDSNMLEMHRLNFHKTMNFWRLSKKINFSDFGIGDYIFFLSKDKKYMHKKEKGIVGYGKVKEIYLGSPKMMWKKYQKENGYNTYEEFIDILMKINRDKKLPLKISSLYLENIAFFQNPIYLSECGMKISNKVESYIYIKPDEVVIKILEYAKKSLDLWSGDNNETIINDELRSRFLIAHKKIGDIKLDEKIKKKAYRELKKYNIDNEYEFVPNKQELFRIIDNTIEIILYNSIEVEKRLLLGQAQLYRFFLKDIKLNIKVLYDDEPLTSLLNNKE